MIWKQINYPDILPGYLISPDGYVKAEGINDKDAFTSSYHSTNGYDFILLNNTDGELQLFPIDDIIAMTYIPIPESLKDKKIKVSHINGDTRDITLDNLQWVEDIEEWKIVVWKNIALNKYHVSSWGRVKNSTGRYITGSPDKDGYYRTALVTNDGHSIGIAIHQLVAAVHVGNYSNINCNVNHINGNKQNNYWKNLEWVTPRQNTIHAHKLGMCVDGEKHKWSKLSEADVIKICNSLVKHNGAVKMVLQELKDNMPGLNRWIISVIKCKNCWKNVSDQYFGYDDFQHINKNHINSDIVEFICKVLVKTNMSINKTFNIARNKGLSKVTKHQICSIKYKKSWKDISDKYF